MKKREELGKDTRLSVVIGPINKSEVDKGLGLKKATYKISVDVRRHDGMHSSGTAEITEVEIQGLGLGQARTYAGTKLAMKAIMALLKLEEVP